MDSTLIALTAFIAGLAIGAYIVYVKRGDGSVVPVDCPKFDYSHEPDFKHISSETAHMLADQYAAWLQAPTPLMADGLPDARCVHFTLADLKKFMWEMETRMCPSKEKKELGIRFYYGKYPDRGMAEYPDLASLPENYQGRHTLFLVPTYLQQGVCRDFDPSQLNSNHDPIVNDDFSSTFIMNHGNIYPPPFEVANQVPNYNNTGILF